MLTDHQEWFGKLEQEIVWKEVVSESNSIQEKENKPWMVVAFGECGQGKSTVLTRISELYNENIAKQEYIANF